MNTLIRKTIPAQLRLVGFIQSVIAAPAAGEGRTRRGDAMQNVIIAAIAVAIAAVIFTVVTTFLGNETTGLGGDLERLTNTTP